MKKRLLSLLVCVVMTTVSVMPAFADEITETVVSEEEVAEEDSTEELIEEDSAEEDSIEEDSIEEVIDEEVNDETVVDEQLIEDDQIEEVDSLAVGSGTYYIISRLDTSYCLSISGASTGNNAKVVVEKKTDNDKNKFLLTYCNDGYYTIRNVNSGLGIQPYNGGTTIYTSICQYQYSSSSDAQKWDLIDNGSGYYLLKNKKSGLYLDIVNASAYSGNTTQLYPRNDGYYAQDFKLVSTTGVMPTPIPEIPKDKMTHNIYLEPDLSKTTGKYDGYSIDFYGEVTPQATYWALCNWSMNNSAFLKKYNATSAPGEYSNSMGAYGGLQNRTDGRKAIMALWEMYYRDSSGKLKKLTAKGMYPSNARTRFGGEGNGVNYIGSYSWKTKKWYRMVFRSWIDESTKTTFVGQWVQDKSTKKWTLVSYFDTKLPNSYMEGDMSLFQENYSTGYFGKRRFRVTNIYALQHGKSSWTSLKKAKLSYDYPEWGYNTAGTHVFGATSSYFYGEAGEAVDDQTEYDNSTKKSITKSISQNNTISVDKIKISKLTGTRKSSSTTVNWVIASTSTPQLKCTITVKDKKGKTVYTKTISRPEKRSYTINKKLAKGSKVTLKVTDIYGGVTTKTINL